MKKLAENKTAKLGEPLTSKVAGNPEASPKVRKARETRRRKCRYYLMIYLIAFVFYNKKYL